MSSPLALGGGGSGGAADGGGSCGTPPKEEAPPPRLRRYSPQEGEKRGEKQSAREVHGFDPADMESNGSFQVMIHSYEAK